VGTRRISRRGVLATALAAGVAGSVQGEERKVAKAARKPKVDETLYFF